MARKPQPLLPFMLESPPGAGDTPAPQDNDAPHPEGDRHAIQDDGTRTHSGSAGAARPAAQEPDAPADDGAHGPRAEDPPPSLEEHPPSNEAGQRPEPDRQRSAGDRPP